MADIDVIREIETRYGIRLNNEKTGLISNTYTIRKNIITEINFGELYIDDWTEFVGYLKKLQNLRSLALRHMHEIDIECLKELSSLKALFLSSSGLKDITSLADFTHLTSLGLGWNDVSDISPLSNLKKLKGLYLHNNKISDLSPIKNLKKIEELALSNNKISDISPLNSLITYFIRLNLDNNNITSLPEWILDGPIINVNMNEYTRNSITLYNNPFIDPPLEIVKQGNEAIKRYFERKRIEGARTMREAKLILVGEGSAGKTSLQKRLMNPKAELPKEDTRTRSISIEDWEYKKGYVAHIWDFGGQDVYYPVHRFFLTENSVFVLLASTRQEHHKFDYWIPTIYQFGGSSPVIIGQTCHDGNRVSWNDIGGYISKPEFNIVKTQELPYYELNLMNRNSGLAAIKKVIMSQLADLPHCKKDVPASWVEVRNKLKKLAETRACIPYDTFKEICNSVPSATFSEAVDYSDCCEFFHNIGVLLWYSKNETLREWVILQPEWAMGAVYRIIDDEKIQKRKGLILASDFKRLWKDKVYEDKQHILKQMLNVFKVAFPKKHKKEDYILPARLISVPCERLWKDDNLLRLEYRFDFMPRGLLNQVSAEMSRYITLDDKGEEEIWNNAVNFVYNETSCQMEEDFFKRRIYLKAKGKDARGLVVLIKEALENAISNYKGVMYDIYVPCLCGECRKGTVVNEYKYADLLRWENNGREEIPCVESNEMLRIDDLLYDAGLFSNTKLIHKTGHEMNMITIFLASSSELEPDRKEFEIFINRENKELIKQGVFLRLELWEDFLDKISKTRLQDEYNKAVRECDIFVSLFYTKAGKFTAEEFETAYESFINKDKPYVYTYFKDGDMKVSDINLEDIKSLVAFRERLKEIEHFPTNYENISDLKHHFSNQLRKLLPALT